jgi:GTPase SAR1 family protein
MWSRRKTESPVALLPFSKQDCRILIMGDAEVGKTLLQTHISKFVQMTLSLSRVNQHWIEYVEMNAGKHSLSRSCIYPTCHGIILVHHVKYPSTYDHLFKALNQFQKYNTQAVPILVVGTHATHVNQKRCKLAEEVNGYSISVDLANADALTPFKDILDSFINQAIQSSQI